VYNVFFSFQVLQLYWKYVIIQKDIGDICNYFYREKFLRIEKRRMIGDEVI